MAKTKFVRMPLYGKSGIVGHTKVDTADYVVLVTAGLTRWNLMRYGKYAYRRVPGGGGERMLLHRYLMGLVQGNKRQVDHINGDRLDNRRSNLRIVSASKQGHNIRRKGNFSSEYRGVSWDKKTNKWVAYCHLGGVKHVGGYFHDEQEARAAAQELRQSLMSHAVD